MSISTQQIQLLCEEFQQSWETKSGIVNIHTLLSDRPDLKDSNRRLLLSLIQVDLENHWARWAEFAEQYARSGEPIDPLLDSWKRIPRFQLYAVLFEGREEAARYWTELANFECYCRDRWGDAIGSSYYKHYFQVETVEYSKRTRRHLRCEFDQNEDFSQVLFALRGTSEIGRQRSKDKESYFSEVNPDGNRIVVASRHEAEVSREQLSLQLLTPRVALITNRSTVNPIRLSHDKTLASGERAFAEFPFTIQIPGRRLVCY